MTTTAGARPRSGGMWAGERLVTTCVIVAMLPPAVWQVARRARTAPAWPPAAHAPAWSACITGVLSAIFLHSHVPIVVTGSPGFPPMGGIQRVVYASVMLMLAVTAAATRLAVVRPRDSGVEPGLRPGPGLACPAGPVVTAGCRPAGPELSDASLRGTA